MNSFLDSIFLMAIPVAIGLGYKKIVEYYEFKYSGLEENKKVYEAAAEFVHGAATDDIEMLLTSCFEIDDEGANEILSQSLPHRTDKDGGYHKFIKSVNRVLGADVYSEQCRTR